MDRRKGASGERRGHRAPSADAVPRSAPDAPRSAPASAARANGHRRTVYCIVPADLAAKLHEPLRRHFRDDPSIEVIVERRAEERRTTSDRRGESPSAWSRAERRKIADPAGRRVAERRVPFVPAEAPALPRRARHHADRLAFVQRRAPSTIDSEDADTARIVTRVQAGDKELFSELYLRYFARVYGYVRVALTDQHEAEDVTQQVFMEVFKALPAYERRRQPFRAWLFTIVRNRTVDALRRGGKLEVTEPGEIDRRRERDAAADEAGWVLDWLTDRDLQVLIERLTPLQRQVLMLRFVVGLSHGEIAAVLDRTDASVRVVQHRALNQLRQRLTALGRRPRVAHRAAPAGRLLRRSRVAYARRFSLLAPGARR